MRTKSSKAKRRPACGAAMKRNGRTRAGTQRWMCVTCSPTGVMRQRDAERGRQLDAFPGWPLGRASRFACDANGDSRAPRKRNAWCRNIRPAIPPCRVRHHTVMADGTYMDHGWCLVMSIDGESGETPGMQWHPNESKAAYMALFSRIPAPDVPITDGLRGGGERMPRDMAVHSDPALPDARAAQHEDRPDLQTPFRRSHYSTF